MGCSGLFKSICSHGYSLAGVAGRLDFTGTVHQVTCLGCSSMIFSRSQSSHMVFQDSQRGRSKRQEVEATSFINWQMFIYTIFCCSKQLKSLLRFKVMWQRPHFFFFSFFSFICISWRLITSQHCSGFGHTLTWISHGVTCIPHPNPPSHLPLHPIPLGRPSAPGPSTCLMHPTWAGDLFHYR